MTKNCSIHSNGHRKYHTNILTFPWMNKKILIRYSLCMDRAIEDVFIGRSKIEINLYAILGSFFCPLSFPYPCAIQFYPIYTRYFCCCPHRVSVDYSRTILFKYTYWLSLIIHVSYIVERDKISQFPQFFTSAIIFLWILTLYLSNYIKALCKRN